MKKLGKQFELRNINLLATYSEVFKKKVKSLDEIKILIKSLPFESACLFLSKVSTGKLDEKKFKSLFYEYLKESNKNAPIQQLQECYDLLMKDSVFSQQTILQIWKYLVLFGEPNNGKEENEIQLIVALVYIGLIVNDTLGRHDESEVYSEFFSNGVFSYSHNFGNTVARTNYIYANIASKKDLFNKNDYLDINKDFIKTNGYSISDYISVLFSLVTSFNNPYENNFPKNINYFHRSRVFPFIEEIIKEEIQDLNKAKEYCDNTLTKSWHFSGFISKPFIYLNDSDFLPISVYLIKKEFFNRVFYKVREIYPKNDERFLSFFGRPFEIYAQNLAEESIKLSKLDYLFKTSFKYGPKRTKDSPDIMIRLGDRLLVIEVKSLRLSFNSVFDSSNEVVLNDINRLIISPLKQAVTRVKEMMEFKVDVISGVKEIDFLVLGNGNIPLIKQNKDIVNEKVAAKINELSIPVKTYNYLSIEEFEYLCAFLEKRKPIFKILERYHLNQEIGENFRNFLLHNSYHPKRPKRIQELFEKTIKEFKSNLFEGQLS